MTLQEVYQQYLGRPKSLEDFYRSKGFVQGGENDNWFAPNDEGGYARFNSDDVNAQFQDTTGPQHYIQQAGDGRYMTYDPGVTLDSPAALEYQRGGMRTIRDSIRHYDPGYSDANWLAPNSEQNPFDRPVYLRSEKYNYGAENPATDGNGFKEWIGAMAAGFGGAAGLAGISTSLAGGTFAAGAGGFTGGLSSALGIPSFNLTGNAFADAVIKKAATGAISSGIGGGNPLTGALNGAAGGALSAGFKSLGGFDGIGSKISNAFDANPLDLSNAGTGATLSSVNPLAELRGGNMSIDDYFDPEYAPVNFSSTYAPEFDPNYYDPQYDPVNFASPYNTMGYDGSGLGGSGLSGVGNAVSRLLGGGAGGSGTGLERLFGLGGGSTLGDVLSLGARLAPGLGALAFAGSQGGVDTSPLSNLVGKGSDMFNSPLDTSRLSSLYGQAGDITNRNTSSALQNFDLKTGQARGDLLNGLERRGVMGSSFGNMDVGNFDTMAGNQRGMLEGQLGLQGITAQSGLANNMLGAEQAGRQQLLQYLANQAAVSDELVKSNLANSKIRSDLFGRSFDILGKAVAPSPSLFGR